MPGAAFSLPEWAYFLGRPGVSGTIRSRPEDFQVTELLLLEPEGEGGHLWLEVENRDANTDWVARQLAECAAAPLRDIGYAGLKDRHALTRQWFSVGMQEAGKPDWQHWQIPGIRILRAERHGRKLKRGALRGNRFELTVRDLAGDLDSLPVRLEALRARGVPNYFGPQRFGFGGANVPRGLQWLREGGRLPRAKRSIYLSAVRSFLFNEVLALRIGGDLWDRIVDGEIAMLAGSRSVFACEMPDPALQSRCAAFDIHPTGPLPGRSGLRPERRAAALERQALQDHQEAVDALDAAGLAADRRSLRLAAVGLEWALDETPAGTALLLRFELPPGAYATAVLRELVSGTSRSE